jgi:hypothetical protein
MLYEASPRCYWLSSATVLAGTTQGDSGTVNVETVR